MSYLPRNQAPTLTITAPTVGTAWSKKQSIKWTAADPDKDTLAVEIFTSKDNGAVWTSLATVDKESSYSWDTTKTEDGTYLLKIVTSDRKSNPGEALSAEKISDLVVISNKAPTLSFIGDKSKLPVSGNKPVTVNGRAYTPSVPIVGVEWQVNGNGWTAAVPEDGIFDSSHEAYSFTTEALPSGQNNLEIKASDAAGNETTEKISVKVP